METKVAPHNRLLPTSAAGLAINILYGILTGTITVIASASLAALIFAGELSVHLALGINAALVTAVVVGLIVSLRGSCGVAIAIPQDRTAPILAIMASGIVAAMPATASADEILFAVLAVIIVTTSVTGAFLLALGLSNAGGLMRFIPYSVLGGFFAGTGWLLILGGMRVMTGLDLESIAEMPQLWAAGLLERWVPGLAITLAIYASSLFLSYAVSVPLVLFVSTAGFFAVSRGTGVAIEDLAGLGWLLGPLEISTGGPFMSGIAILSANGYWDAVAGLWTSIGTVLIISAVSILLTASALELLTGQDIDVNRELRVSGLANLAAGLSGGMVGFHSLSISSLVIKLGGTNRSLGLFAALTCAAALAFGSELMGYLPRVVLGGLLMYLGFSFIGRWLIATWGRLPLNEYLVIPLILVVVAAAGFIEGVLTGLLAALTLFVLNYSRTNVVRQELSGEHIHSTVERNPDDEHVLQENAGQIHVLKLRGYLFFGTATQLSSRVRERAEDSSRAPLRFVLLDFDQVTGIDSSATYAFQRMQQGALLRRFTLVLTGLPATLQDHLHLAELAKTDTHLQLFADLDHGLEWCENRLLDSITGGGARRSSTMLEHLADLFPEDQSRAGFLAYLTEHSFATGDVLIRQGDAAGDLYFLEEGEVSVYLESPGGDLKRIRRTGCGAVLGEIGFYLATPRSASVIASSSGRAYRLTAGALERMEAERPDFAAALHRFMADLLAERLLHTTRTLEAVIN